MKKICVIGGGAWGTALAQSFAVGGRDVTLWAREEEVTFSINSAHENTMFLPGVALDPSLKASSDLKHVIFEANLLLLVTPAQYLRSFLEDVGSYLPSNTPLVICSKGVELKSKLLLSKVAAQIVPDSPIAILSGPTFAAEVARGLPWAATIATEDDVLLQKLQETLRVKNFRPYSSNDVIGAEIGGAIKNVMAIACGIIHGKGLGENARAALVTRGLAEISRLSEAMGGRRETLMGLCGIGDLMLTCSSMQSRNFSLGAALGKGQILQDILAERTAVTEGVYTAHAAYDLAQKHGVEMPITQTIHYCLNEGLPIEKAIEAMLSRPLTSEI